MSKRIYLKVTYSVTGLRGSIGFRPGWLLVQAHPLLNPLFGSYRSKGSHLAVPFVASTGSGHLIKPRVHSNIRGRCQSEAACGLRST
jgi:hypothetical protein